MVESQPGAGSEFAFTLPLEGLHAAASGSAPLSRFNNQRVLVVDDNSTNLRLLDTMLRQMGLMPSCVDNAGEALRRAAEGAALAADPARRADAGYGRRIPGAGALRPARGPAEPDHYAPAP